jgi:hypothetical protein
LARGCKFESSQIYALWIESLKTNTFLINITKSKMLGSSYEDGYKFDKLLCRNFFFKIQFVFEIKSQILKSIRTTHWRNLIYLSGAILCFWPLYQDV